LAAEVVRIDGEGDFGIKVLTQNPAEVGGDRIANALGAYYGGGGPCIVVDAGTATTFDYISPEGAYCGGVIAPGIVTGAKELWRRTRMLPEVEIDEPERVIGATTTDCIQSGVFYGSLSQIEGIVRRMWDELGGECRVLLTGGQAGKLKGKLGFECQYDPHLTLKGIAYGVNPALR
jgi:type III pantothenate kinase